MFVLIIIAVVFIIILCAYWAGNDERQREKNLRITIEEIQESDKMMKTEFFDKIKSEIWKQNIEGIKHHIKNNYSNLGVAFPQVYISTEKIYVQGDYGSCIKFKDLGYKDLNFSQSKILLYSISRLDGYDGYKLNNGKYDAYTSINYDYWKKIYDNYKNKTTVNLKDIY